jgi:chemotaxis regulatin CheY-phosphate phosphatase CheZ
MSDGRSVATISEADYDAIELAVMETERGRWFLREYARRNRNADTQVLLDAIGRLEQAVAGERVAQDIDRLRNHLREMATAITRTKAEIATIHAIEQEHSQLFAASEALDAITRTTEQATSDILAAAEHIQESAWTLREDGADPKLCNDLDRRATEIYTACSFQDLTAQRIGKIIQTLRYLEGRINAMIAIWDQTEGAVLTQEDPDGPPARRSEIPAIDLTQSDIDDVIVDQDLFSVRSSPASGEPEAPSLAVDREELAFVEAQQEPEERSAAAEVPRAPLDDPSEPIAFVEASPPPVPTAHHIRTEAFADIDALPTREKLRLFT